MTPLRLLVPFGLAAALALVGPAGAETDPEAARAVVADLLEEAAAASGDAAADEAARREAVEAALAEAVDFDAWERATLPEGALTEAERETFRELLPQFLARLYLERLPGGEPAEVTDARSLRRDALVSTLVPRAEGAGIPVDYRLSAEQGGEPRVVDILVGGASYALILREGFGDILETDDAEGLFAYMRGNGG